MMYTSGTTAKPKGCPLTHEAIVRTGDAINARFSLTDDGRLVGSAAAVPPELDPSAHGSASGRLALRDDGRLRGRGRGEADRRGAGDVHVRHVPDAEPGAARPRRLPERRHRPRCASSTRSRRPTCSERSRRRCRTPCRSRPTAAPSSAGSSPRTIRPRRPTSARRAAGRRSRGSRCASSIPRAGTTSPAGELGEIVARGFGMFEGYHNDPQRTAEAIEPGGWFHTGDIGSVDADGRIAYHGRTKDMLKVGGENVAALEIESYLSRHPAVRLAQVVSIPDARLTEVPAAFVEVEPGQEVTRGGADRVLPRPDRELQDPAARALRLGLADVGHEDPEVPAPRGAARRARVGRRCPPQENA